MGGMRDIVQTEVDTILSHDPKNGGRGWTAAAGVRAMAGNVRPDKTCRSAGWPMGDLPETPRRNCNSSLTDGY